MCATYITRLTIQVKRKSVLYTELEVDYYSNKINKNDNEKFH